MRPGSAIRLIGSFLVLIGLNLGVDSHAAEPAARAPAPPQQVEQWGVFELTLPGPSEGNPFTDVRFGARFSDGTQSFEVEGFYDGDGLYRVRFMPNRPGRWQWHTHSNRWPLTGKSGSFAATAPGPGNHGPVGVRNTYHFAYADGTPFRPIGTTMYSWAHRGERLESLSLQALAGAPFNKVRMLVYPQSAGADRHPPEHFPFAGTPPRQWDLTRFNPAFWRHLERRVGQLRDLGIEADLILHHPYDDPRAWGFDDLPREVDERYARYLVARLAAFRNVWWSLANEWDFVRTRTEADWEQLGQLLQRIDPYNRLRSIHNGKRLFDQTRPWITHVSLQNGMAAAEASRAVLLREVWRKPLVFDEIKYEGNHDRRWAQLSGQELVQRFWAVTIAGGYATHGEYITDNPDRTVWVAQGAHLRGQSPPRLAFLKQVLATSPPEGIDPIDTFEDLTTAGQAGRYYLVYFGQQAPTQWVPQLYVAGMSDGLAFKAELIDTWNMTVVPLKRPLVFKVRDRYHFAEASGQVVAMPGRPYMAIRLTLLKPGERGAGRADVDD